MVAKWIITIGGALIFASLAVRAQQKKGEVNLAYLISTAICSTIAGAVIWWLIN